MLFGWALGRNVSEEEAKRCAKREPGRSWEALEGEMAALGEFIVCTVYITYRILPCRPWMFGREGDGQLGGGDRCPCWVWP